VPGCIIISEGLWLEFWNWRLALRRCVNSTSLGELKDRAVCVSGTVKDPRKRRAFQPAFSNLPAILLLDTRSRIQKPDRHPCL
jgi:hypothetical protein